MPIVINKLNTIAIIGNFSSFHPVFCLKNPPLDATFYIDSDPQYQHMYCGLETQENTVSVPCNQCFGSAYKYLLHVNLDPAFFGNIDPDPGSRSKSKIYLEVRKINLTPF